MKQAAWISLLLFTGILFCTDALAAKPKHPTWIDPDTARAEDPDFSIQGEYGPSKGYGVQVVALGDHTFDAYILEGGLPGDGWDRSKKRTRIPGQTKGDVTEFEGDGYRAVIKKERLVLEQNGKTVAKLKRQERKSPTLGAKPSKGAVILFDGTGVNEWDKGRMSEDKLLMEGTMSKKRFQDHSIHIEFLLPYKPSARGQGRGNSGIYVQGRYEAQMLDSFGLEGKMNEAGGLYSIKDPDVNMCYPPLSWQTYDIDFTAARFKDGKKVKNAMMTVRLNGIVVQKDVVCDHSTPASRFKEGADPGPIYLQNHGNPVRYRNIWVVEKQATAVPE